MTVGQKAPISDLFVEIPKNMLYHCRFYNFCGRFMGQSTTFLTRAKLNDIFSFRAAINSFKIALFMQGKGVWGFSKVVLGSETLHMISEGLGPSDLVKCALAQRARSHLGMSGNFIL